MKAAVCKAKQLVSVEEVPTPKPGPGQVLVRVKYSAICGSDVHRFQYGAARPGSIMGHEYIGAIAELGKGVTRWKPGDRVICGGGAPPEGIPVSASRQARYSARTVGLGPVSTWGGFAEYAVLDDWRPLPIPEGVSDELAVLTEPCSVAVHAVRLSRLHLGDKVAILGAGPIGLLLMQAVKAAGAAAVFVSETAPARLRAAKELGASMVFDPRRTELVPEVVKLTGGLGADVVFDCAAGRLTLQHSLEMARRSGQVVLISMAWEDVPLLTVEWIGREVELKAAYGSSPEDWRISLELMKDGRVRSGPIVDESCFLPLDGIQDALMGLMTPKDQRQLVIKF